MSIKSTPATETGFLIRIEDGPAKRYQVRTSEKPDRTVTLAQLPKGWHVVHGKKEWPVQATYVRGERRMLDGQIVYPYTLKTATTGSEGRGATARASSGSRVSSGAMAIRSPFARLFRRDTG